MKDLREVRGPRVSEHAGALAHDLRNLLQVVLNHADLLACSLEQDDPRHEDLRSITEAARRAGSLAQKMMDETRAHNGHTMKAIDLRPVVQEVVRMLGRSLGDNVTITLRIPAQPVEARIDPAELEQILLNLLINARDAMTEGGRVTVSARPMGSSVLVSVADDGAGMTPDVRDRAFAPFFSTKGNGTRGLGLASCQTIARRRGGRIEVRSEPGRGSVFDVYLPRTSVVD